MPPRTPLTVPDPYFRGRESVLPVGTGVFLLCAIVNAAILYLIGHTILGQVEYLTSATRSGFQRSFVFFSAGLLLAACGQVLLVAAILWTYFDTDRAGSFRDTIAVSAWAYVPFTIESILRYLRARREIREITLSNADTAQIMSHFDELVFSEGPGMTLVTAVAVVWMVYILAGGTAGALDLNREQTVKPAVALGIVLFGIKVLP